MIGEPDPGIRTSIAVEDNGQPIVILYSRYNYKDTSTPIPNEQLREAVRLIEIGRIDSAIVSKQDSIISKQKDLINSKVVQISALNAKVKSYDLLIDQYKKQITQLNKAGTVQDDWVKALRKEVKQQRTQKTIIGILAILGIGSTIYLFAK